MPLSEKTYKEMPSERKFVFISNYAFSFMMLKVIPLVCSIETHPTLMTSLTPIGLKKICRVTLSLYMTIMALS